MRLVGLLLSFAFVVGSSACKDKGDANVAPDPAALKAQQDLMARREALSAERKKLVERRQTIEVEKEAAKGDPTKLEALEKEKSEIDSRIQKSTSDESTLANELTKVTAVAGDVATREAGLAARERAVAMREKDVYEREQSSVRALSEAANQLRADALKFKDSCSAGAAPMIVQVPAKSGNYSRAEVDGIYGKAKKLMRDKGLIPGDQWAGASLDAGTAESLGKQEWGAAFATASQLVNYANQFKVDRTFVQAKIGRLNLVVRSSKRDEQIQKQLTDGLSDVMIKFGDGNHGAANAKLNALFSLVR